MSVNTWKTINMWGGVSSPSSSISGGFRRSFLGSSLLGDCIFKTDGASD